MNFHWFLLVFLLINFTTASFKFTTQGDLSYAKLDNVNQTIPIQTISKLAITRSLQVPVNLQPVIHCYHPAAISVASLKLPWTEKV